MKLYTSPIPRPSPPIACSAVCKMFWYTASNQKVEVGKAWNGLVVYYMVTQHSSLRFSLLFLSLSLYPYVSIFFFLFSSFCFLSPPRTFLSPPRSSLSPPRSSLSPPRSSLSSSIFSLSSSILSLLLFFILLPSLPFLLLFPPLSPPSLFFFHRPTKADEPPETPKEGKTQVRSTIEFLTSSIRHYSH